MNNSTINFGNVIDEIVAIAGEGYNNNGCLKSLTSAPNSYFSMTIFDRETNDIQLVIQLNGTQYNMRCDEDLHIYDAICDMMSFAKMGNR